MQLELPEGPFAAYLFDCDGTIVDSMPLHYVAWNKVLGEYGAEFDEALFYAWGGRPVSEIIESLNEMHGISMPVQETRDRKEKMYFENIAKLKGIPEVIEHVHLSHGKVRFAVVSGSTRDSVVASLNALGILEKFETLVCAGDYTKGKPDPEPFLMAAERLGVAPKDCLVFEDTDMGIESAKAAGMKWVKVMQPWERPQAG